MSSQTLLTVRAGRPDDPAELAPRLRVADLREIAAATGEQPLDALSRGLACSEPALAVVAPADRVLALFGVVPDTDGAGIAWLLGSDDLVRRRAAFLRTARVWLDRLHQDYRRLWNYVDARNEVHLRWLAWCGFHVVRTVPAYGIEGRPFHEVERIRAREAHPSC